MHVKAKFVPDERNKRSGMKTPVPKKSPISKRLNMKSPLSTMRTPDRSTQEAPTVDTQDLSSSAQKLIKQRQYLQS